MFHGPKIEPTHIQMKPGHGRTVPTGAKTCQERLRRAENSLTVQNKRAKQAQTVKKEAEQVKTPKE
jgi:hypothetical protein